MGDAGEAIVWDYLIYDVIWQFIPGISHHINAALLIPHHIVFDFLFFIFFALLQKSHTPHQEQLE